MKKNSKRSIITWPGSQSWLLGGLLLSLLFVINRRRLKMSSINENAWEVFGLLLDEGFFFETAKIITAQAAFETGNFTSDIYRENKNPFGMKLPEKRRTTAIGTNRGHAVFNSISDAIRDFYLYYTYVNLPLIFRSVETYVNAINVKGYFSGDVDVYKKGVQYYYKLYFQ